MKMFSSSTIVSPTPGVRNASKRDRAAAGNSSHDIGRTIVSMNATPRVRPGWRAAQSNASAPPQSWPTSTTPSDAGATRGKRTRETGA
jgi:hypothetical protein